MPCTHIMENGCNALGRGPKCLGGISLRSPAPPPASALPLGKALGTSGGSISSLFPYPPALSILTLGIGENSGGGVVGRYRFTVWLGPLRVLICCANPLTTVSLSEVWQVSPYPHLWQISVSLCLHQ